MSERVQELAREFDRSTDQLVTTIREMSDGDWEKITSAEGWPVANVAHHVAFYMDIEGEFVHRLANRKPTVALAPDAIDDLNDRMVAEHAGISKSEVLQAIAANRTLVREVFRNLTDEQLAIAYPGRSISLRMSNDMTMTIDQITQRLIVGHVNNHLESIKTTIGG